jgi:small-conductance mechanosensitive channel
MDGFPTERIQAAVRDITNTLSFLPAPLAGTVVLVATVIGAVAIHAVLSALTRRALAHRPHLRSLLARTRGPVRLAFVVVAVGLVLPALPLSPDTRAWVGAILRVVFDVLVGWVALVAIDIGATVYLLRFQTDTEDNLLARKHVTQVRILRRAAGTLVVLCTAGAALMSFDAVREIGMSLFASAGVAGIAAGIAARPVLSNLIAGIQLAMTQPIRLDDAVIVENEWGSIEEITSTYVVVKLWDLRRMVVPLTYFIEKPFQNWTREGSAILGTVLLYLDYTAPIDRIRAKASEIATQSKLWDRQALAVQVTDAKEHTIEVRVLVSARNASEAFELRCELREKLIAFLQREFPGALPRQRTDVAVAPNLLPQAQATQDGQRQSGERDERPAAAQPARAHR